MTLQALLHIQSLQPKVYFKYLISIIAASVIHPDPSSECLS